jgi:uncharacterized membrane protein YgaE (UPF0421/DUF939 family)
MTDITAPARPAPGQGFAITALVLGCVSVFMFWLWAITPILAIIFGAIAIKRADSAGAKRSGMAIAGVVLGIVFASLFVLIMVAFILGG